MKEAKTIFKAENVTSADFGKLSDLGEYMLELSPEVKIPGKVFGGAMVGATGCEFSFQTFAPGAESGFIHTHKTHEELYFILRGNGEFQVDGHNIPVQEGSVVRVAPDGRRTLRNNGTDTLVVLCVQYPEAKAGDVNASDGVILADKVQW